MVLLDTCVRLQDLALSHLVQPLTLGWHLLAVAPGLASAHVELIILEALVLCIAVWILWGQPRLTLVFGTLWVEHCILGVSLRCV